MPAHLKMNLEFLEMRNRTDTRHIVSSSSSQLDTAEQSRGLGTPPTQPDEAEMEV